MSHSSEHTGGTTKLFMMVWISLLVMTIIEVYLAYIHLAPGLMISILMALSLAKAALIIAYFMHLKFEKMSLILTLIPMWVMVTCLFFIFFPDSFRLLEFRIP